MAFLEFNGIKIAGLSAAVPSSIEECVNIYKKMGGYEHFLSTTGIERHRKSDSSTCSSDLCAVAAEKLISDLQWNKQEIEALIFVSQTPDYVLPATSVLLQERLGLPESCYTLDISLGCSGWVYALSVLASLMAGGGIRKGLLLAGDTILKLCSEADKSTYPLFGDAGTATALEYHAEQGSPLRFCMNSDGSGYEAIIIRDSGYRHPVSHRSFEEIQSGEGVVRNRLNLEMDGMSVFSFGISKAPQVVNALTEHFGLMKDEIDYYVFHQANLFMNEKIRKKLKLPSEKVPYSLRDFANTSCASIPLTMVTQLAPQLSGKHLRFIACGFGVGLSWGAVSFETEHIICSDLIEL